jgi:hypothetical protein
VIAELILIQDRHSKCRTSRAQPRQTGPVALAFVLRNGGEVMIVDEACDRHWHGRRIGCCHRQALTIVNATSATAG